MSELPIPLLNTHADDDHIGSNEELAEFYMHTGPKKPKSAKSFGFPVVMPPHLLERAHVASKQKLHEIVDVYF